MQRQYSVDLQRVKAQTAAIESERKIVAQTNAKLSMQLSRLQKENATLRAAGAKLQERARKAGVAVKMPVNYADLSMRSGGGAGAPIQKKPNSGVVHTSRTTPLIHASPVPEQGNKPIHPSRQSQSATRAGGSVLEQQQASLDVLRQLVRAGGGGGGMDLEAGIMGTNAEVLLLGGATKKKKSTKKCVKKGVGLNKTSNLFQADPACHGKKKKAPKKKSSAAAAKTKRTRAKKSVKCVSKGVGQNKKTKKFQSAPKCRGKRKGGNVEEDLIYGDEDEEEEEDEDEEAEMEEDEAEAEAEAEEEEEEEEELVCRRRSRRAGMVADKEDEARARETLREIMDGERTAGKGTTKKKSTKKCVNKGVGLKKSTNRFQADPACRRRKGAKPAKTATKKKSTKCVSKGVKLNKATHRFQADGSCKGKGKKTSKGIRRAKLPKRDPKTGKFRAAGSATSKLAAPKEGGFSVSKIEIAAKKKASKSVAARKL